MTKNQNKISATHKTAGSINRKPHSGTICVPCKPLQRQHNSHVTINVDEEGIISDGTFSSVSAQKFSQLAGAHGTDIRAPLTERLMKVT